MDLFELQKQFVTTLIHDTIETYPGTWRLVHEASQNAADAIYKNEKVKRGKISIDLYLGTNKVSVKDNGDGIPIGKFGSIFQLGGGDKRDDEIRKFLKGSQGVGIKATCYTSKYFKVVTIHEGQAWEYVATGLHKFGDEGFNQKITPPSPKASSEASGTTLEYSLEDFSVVDFLKELVADFLEDTQKESITDDAQFKEALETYFRTKTYLGCVLRLLLNEPQLKPIDVELSLHFDFPAIEDHKKFDIQGCSFLSSPDYHGKILTHTFEGKYLDVLDLHSNLKKGHQADKVFTNFEELIGSSPDPTIRKILIQKFDKAQAKRLLFGLKRDRTTNTTGLEENASLVRKHKGVFDKLNGIYLVMSQRTYMGEWLHVGPRQILSVNGLPTNIALGTPRGALAYLNNIHLVLDIDAKLGFGKRNIPPRTKGAIDSFYADAWAMLRRVCPAVVGVREGKDPTDRSVWDKEKEYEAYNDRDNLFRDRPLFFKTTPVEEQEVVALFFELLGRKLLKGYFPFRVGGNQAAYDALFFIGNDTDITMPKKFTYRELKTIEFKHRLSDLIADFDNQDKFLEEIDLVICWENNCVDDTSEYNIHLLEREGIPALPGAQLRIQKGTRSCQVLVLKDFVDSLQLSVA